MIRVLFLLALAVLSACGGTDNVPGDSGAPDATNTPKDAGDALIEDANVVEDAAIDPDGNVDPDGAVDPDASPPVMSPNGVVTRFADQVGFIYAPGGPQTGVVPGAIDARKIAVIRGNVLDTSGAPIAGASISVHDTPDLGVTTTRADGSFELVVNGGARIVLDYAKAGYLPAQREVDPPWTNFVYAPDVVLTALDPLATTVMLDLASPLQTARGSMATDADGMRQTSMIFRAGTTAELVLADGTTQPFAGGHVHATEFTVGAGGPSAMPAALPPSSGYTYAIELSFDEAGAGKVRFNQPVVVVTDNFLNLPAGEVIPVGTYDSARTVWLAEANGSVVDLLGLDGTLALVDADGDGAADDAGTLAMYGISDEERQALAELYPLGGSVWRFATDHFSPFDLNPCPVFPEDAFPPPRTAAELNALRERCGILGSFISCDTQALGQLVEIAGTRLALVYQNERVPGRKSDDRIHLRLSGDILPPNGLVRIDVHGTIAGQKFDQSFAPQTNLFFDYTWDGKDAYGSPVFGQRIAHGYVSYVYVALFGGAAGPYGFGNSSGELMDTQPQREGRTMEMRTPFAVLLGGEGPDARELGLGGWTLSSHHVFDPATNTVYLGSGGTETPYSTVTYFGGAERQTVAGDPEGHPVDDIVLGNDNNVFEVGPDGTIYYLKSNRLYSVDLDGIVHRVAGCDSCPTATFGDGSLATEIPSTSPGWNIRQFAVGFDGRIYLAIYLNGNRAIWRMDPNKKVYRIAGRLDVPANVNFVEGDLARDSDTGIDPFTVRSDGSVVFEISRSSTSEVWAVNPNGRLSRVAGVIVGTAGCAAYDIPAREHCFTGGIGKFHADRQGRIWVASTELARIDADGIVRHVAGDINVGCEATADPQPIAEFCPRSMHDFRIGPDDVPYGYFITFARSLGIMRLDAVTSHVYGGGLNPVYGAPATAFASSRIPDFGIRPDGSIVVRDKEPGFARIVEVKRPVLRVDQNYVIASGDGRTAWVFDPFGRHLATKDTITGAPIYTFAYELDGKLAGIADVAGQVTTIERDASGKPTAIVAPGGQRTALTVDADGWMTKIERPGGEHVDITYFPNTGLMSSYSDERQRTANFGYDALGRLETELKHDGTELLLARNEVPDGIEIVAALDGVNTVYRTVRTGDAMEHSVTQPNGATTAMIFHQDGVRDLIGADGTIASIRDSTDPRFPLAYASTLTVTKGSRTLFADIYRSVSGGTGYFGSGTFTQETTIDGHVFRMAVDNAARTLTMTSPSGRTTVIGYDSVGRMASVDRGAGWIPTEISYDTNGLVESLTAGMKTETYEYDASRRLTAVVDELRRTEYTYDAADHIATRTDPLGAVTFTWHEDGTLASFAAPGGQVHALESNPHELYTSYLPPGAAVPYRRIYDAGEGLSEVRLPSGRAQVYARDGEDRLRTITTPEATIAIGYASPADHPATVTRTPAMGLGNAQTISYVWDTSLPSVVTMSGATAGTWSTSFGDDFRPTTETFTSGSDTVMNAFAYDDDKRISQYGPMTFTRADPARVVTELAIGSSTIRYTYAGDGQLASKTVRVAGADRYSVAMTYGALGIPMTRSETAGAMTHAYAYTHDIHGELLSVERDGVSVETYTYDPRGNRTSGGAAYDAGDRITSGGYVIDQDGFLAARGADSFVYSAAGELISATIGGARIDYDYDAFRRIVQREDTQFYYANPFLIFSPSAYRAQGEALTSLYYDENGHLAAIVRGTTRWIVASDQVGTPRLVIDETTGATVKELTWDSFGRKLSDSNPAFYLPIGFASGLADETTHLVRFGMRDYDPAAGRWTARDPSLLNGGQLNLYAYVGSSPVHLRDPLGLFCIGGSAYSLIGGGGRFCMDQNGSSVCAEAGFGAGDSIDFEPFSNIDNNFFGFEGGLKTGFGPFRAGCDGTYGVDMDKFRKAPCAIVKNGDCKLAAFGFEYSPFNKNNSKISLLDLHKDLSPTNPGESKVTKEGKFAIKDCANFKWTLF